MANRQALGLSIAAINDSLSPRPRLDTLAPSKEAQEARLAQAYQDALQELQKRNFLGARRLLESILQNPIILLAKTSQKSAAGTESVDRNRMLQLRFSSLKNLGAALSEEEGPKQQNDALNSYLEAASMDQKDVVLWNRLGTLACALGHINIARCAFEQGLVCSPRNWICMEKLVEVLIAIGDEEACRYVVRCLLKISPSHPRASYVDDVLEGRGRVCDSLKSRENLPDCLAKLNVLPRGLDLLEPQHSNLSFPKKRRFPGQGEDEDRSSSKRRMLRTAEEKTLGLSLSEIISSIVNRLQSVVSMTTAGDSDTPAGNDSVSKDRDSKVSGEPWANQPVGWMLDAATWEMSMMAGESVEEGNLAPGGEDEADQRQSASRGSDEVSQGGAGGPGEQCRNDHRRSKSNNAPSQIEDHSEAIRMVVDIDAPNGAAEAAMYEEELPVYDRRNFRQEKVRTRGSDKSEIYVDKHKTKDRGESLRQLLEPYLSSSVHHTGCEVESAEDPLHGDNASAISQNGSHDVSIGDFEKENGHEESDLCEKRFVQRFITAMKVNSGIYCVAHELLEKLSAIELRFKFPDAELLVLERLTRQYSWAKRSKQCSLFLAELCLDLFMSSSYSDEETSQQYLTDCDFHLCRVLECMTLNSGPILQSYSLEKLSKLATDTITTEVGGQERNATQEVSCGDVRDSKEGSRDESSDAAPLENHLAEQQPESDCLVTMSGVGGLEVQVSSFDAETTDWSLWARYHWLNGRLMVYREKLEEAYQDLTQCSNILDGRTKQTGKTATIGLPHCKSEPILTHARVQSKLYELQIDKLLKFTVPDMIEQARYSELIVLLVPVLITKIDKAKDASRNESRRVGIGGSPEYACLDVLVSACERVQPADLSVALQCHTRKLEILCDAVRSCSSKRKLVGRDAANQLEPIGSSEVESKSVAEEVKSISKCASLFLESLGISGWSVIVGDRKRASTQPSSLFLRRIQMLLLNLMCHYTGNSQDAEGGSRLSPGSSFNLQLDGMSFVEAVIAFCRLQHLDAGASLEQQVSLLRTFHDVLAREGLCCAGEGIFLKMALKHLRTIKLKIIQSACQSRLCAMTVENGLMEIDENLEGKPELTEESKNDFVRDKTVIDASDTEGGEMKNSAAKAWKDDVEEEVGQRRHDLGFDSVLDHCFFCLYGLTVGSSGSETSSQSHGFSEHKNTNCGDFETAEECALVYEYVLPYAKSCSRFRLQKLRKVLRAVHKQFSVPPPDILARRAVDCFLDDTDFDEVSFQETLSSSGKNLSLIIDHALRPQAAAASGAQSTEEDLHTIESETLAPQESNLGEEKASGAVLQNGGPSSSGTITQDSFASVFSEVLGWNVRGSFSEESSEVELGEPYLGVYENLYHFISEIEDTSASDKWAGFVLAKEGEEFVNQNASLLKYDLCCNPLRLESWSKLSKTYDEEAELMLNDGSKRINVIDWKKDPSLIRRVEMCRQRTRRCLFVALALSNTPEKQSEMHELLALVYYESLQNVAPSYDQRCNIPKRDAAWISRCESALRHFQDAFRLKSDWTHLFYIGKLYEKLGRPHAEAFDAYKRAVDLNSAAVDPIYRLHASRLKLLCRSERHDYEVLRLIAEHCYTPSIKETVSGLLVSLPDRRSDADADETASPSQEQQVENAKVEGIVTDIRRQLFTDCSTVMKACIEGELKHYHKARYRLAHAYYTSVESQDIDRAKEELTFCFRSTRSQFTINMWEIDASLRKIRRKAADHTNLDVQMPESSRKFITCVRKYLLLYLTICEKTGAINTLERAFNTLRTDKKFSLCLDDISRLSLGKYIQALAAAIWQADNDVSEPSVFPLLEKLFSLFMDYGSSWSESLQISFAESGESTITESIVYGYIHRYLNLLESEVRLDVLEGINEKIRKRSKNLYKLLCSQTAEICRHACLAWSRALCVSLASITPVPSKIEPLGGSELRLVVDLQEDIFRTSSYKLESDGSPPSLEEMTAKAADPIFIPMTSISSMKNVPVVQASQENLEKASSLLRSTYVFFRDSPSGSFARGINLLLMGAVGVSSEEASGHCEELDLSVPRKLLLWSFALVHGRAGNVTEAVRFCEEHAKG